MQEYKTVLPGGNTQGRTTLQKGDFLEYNNVLYTVTDPETCAVAVTKGKNNTLQTVSIPDTVTIKDTECKVTQIRTRAFSGYPNLTKVNIGKHVQTIEKQAFMGSSSLQNITLEEGSALKTVKANAFKNTSSKITVKAPGMTAKQRRSLLKQLKNAGMSDQAVIK